MGEQGDSRLRASALEIAGWVLVLLGWGVAVVIGHGSELQRMVLSTAALLPGGVLLALAALRHRPVWIPALLLVSAAAVLLAGRAFFSPVWDLARLDLVLIGGFVLCFFGSARLLGTKGGRTLLLGALALVFLGHLTVGLYQAFFDPSFAVLRLPRGDQSGVSGLFWHRNYLAGMLSFLLPVNLGLLLTRKSIWGRLALGLLLLAGLGLAFLTKSRAGFLAVMFGLGAVAAFAVYRRSFSWSLQARFASAAALLIAGGVAIVVSWFLVSQISEDRFGGTPNLEESYSQNSRVGLAGMAFDQWQESPLLGTGGRSFSYLAVRHWDSGAMPGWLGNPVMVHNDYLQTLAEYGLLGFLSVLACAGLLGLRAGSARVARDDGESGGSLLALRMAAVGALVAAMTHSIFDFSLHILPNIMLLALLTGSLAVVLPSSSARGSWFRGLPQVIILLFAVAILFVVSRRELAAADKWIAVQTRMIQGSGSLDAEAAQSYHDFLVAAPEFHIARIYGKSQMALYQRDPLANEAARGEALWSLRIAVDRNPFDPEALGNYAVALEFLDGKSAEATPYYVRAVEASWRRENKYGMMRALAQNLARRAERHFFRGEKEKALALYQDALAYLESSWNRGYRPGGRGAFEAGQKNLQDRMNLLQNEGVKAQPDPTIPPPPAAG